jgi:hypothetical protein
MSATRRNKEEKRKNCTDFDLVRQCSAAKPFPKLTGVRTLRAIVGQLDWLFDDHGN